MTRHAFVTRSECREIRRRVRDHGVPYKRLAEDLDRNPHTIGFHASGDCLHQDVGEEPVAPGDRP
jgi:hypothetical protein